MADKSKPPPFKIHTEESRFTIQNQGDTIFAVIDRVRSEAKRLFVELGYDIHKIEITSYRTQQHEAPYEYYTEYPAVITASRNVEDASE